MPELSLDSLTLMDVSPAELVLAADAAGFDCVSLWARDPAVYPNSLLGENNVRDCARVLADSRVRIRALEVFDLASAEAVHSCRKAFEFGARLGAEAAVAIHFSNPDGVQASELLALMAEIGREYGLGINLEPVASGQTATMAQGSALIAASGADVGLVFDPWHLVATGTPPASLARLDPAIIRCVQLCDGPVPLTPEHAAYGSVYERAFPGEGVFPLAEMLRHLPRNVPIGIECPGKSRVALGTEPLEQARQAMNALRTTLARIEHSVPA